MLEASIKKYNELMTEMHSEFVFFDRGIIDSICYMKMEKIPISEHIVKLIKEYFYNKNVFILPPWKEIYRTDNERKQNWIEAELTYKKMRDTYQGFGYNPIIVPKIDVNERVKFIIESINVNY